jgi:hypothetical protein
MCALRGPHAARVAVAVAILAGQLTAFQSASDHGGYRPHYQGYGVHTAGGRGGAIHVVTNLEDAGPGSLRAALTATGARFVVFEVSGTISLASPIVISSAFLTLAGQTAPSPGVTVRNHSIVVDTHDVVLQHLRLRMGDAACQADCSRGGADALYVRDYAFNIVLDHLSISWGTHGGVSFNAWSGPHEPYDIAMLDCMVSENLAKSRNPMGTGTLFMPTPRGTATFARNLHAHNGNRMPWVSPGWRFSGYNNVAYNSGQARGDVGTLGFFQIMGGYNTRAPFDVAWIGNVSIPGPNTDPDGKAVKVFLTPTEASQPNSLYLEDNTGPQQEVGSQWRGVTYQGAAQERGIRSDRVPSWHASVGYEVLPNARVLTHVLANAGARPNDRDVVDARVVSDVTARKGGRIASQSEVGGWPPLQVVRQRYAVPPSPNAPGRCGATTEGVARTVIECDLEARARRLEPALHAGTGVAPPARLRIR